MNLVQLLSRLGAVVKDLMDMAHTEGFQHLLKDVEQLVGDYKAKQPQ